MTANRIWLCIVCLCFAQIAAGQTDNDQLDLLKPELKTIDIVEGTIECLDCFDYEIVGICFWLKCTFFSCDVETSIKVKHYIPDLVVSSYTSDSAWKDTRSWNDEPQGGIARSESPRDMDTFLDWKSVDIITHPALLIYNELGEEDLFCQSQQDTPFMPLFLSGLDPFWSESMVERALQLYRMDFDYIETGGGGSSSSSSSSSSDDPFAGCRTYPQGQLPDDITGGWWTRDSGGRLVMMICGGDDDADSGGSSLDAILNSITRAGYWAPVYPRCGWGAHPYDPINAAVAAHRAADIVTRQDEPHIYWPTDGDCDHKCWKPGPVTENTDDDNKFQMLFPVLEKSASPFGGSATWANGKSGSPEMYAWSLWRKYMCCAPEGQLFLFDISIDE